MRQEKPDSLTREGGMGTIAELETKSREGGFRARGDAQELAREAREHTEVRDSN